MMSTPSLEDRIGEVIKEVRFTVEPGKIAEFARAIHDDNPIYYDEVAARAAGYAAIPAPLTFSVASAHYSGGDAMNLPRRLGLALDRVVHGEQRWRYYRPVVAGDVLTGITRLTAVDHKQSAAGTMICVTVTTDYRDAADTLCLTECAVLIELPKR